MSTTVRDNEINDHTAKYMKRKCNVTLSEQKPYDCADKRNCQ